MASDIKRVAVLLLPNEFRALKEAAGDVPLSRYIRRAMCGYGTGEMPDLTQPGNEKANVADRPSEDAARTPRVSLEGRRTGPRRGSRNGASHRVLRTDKTDVAHVGVSDSSVANSQPDAVVRHTATSDWHTCLCPSCTDRRKRLDLAIGEIPTKREKRYGKK